MGPGTQAECGYPPFASWSFPYLAAALIARDAGCAARRAGTGQIVAG
jgi:hypothetical protein